MRRWTFIVTGGAAAALAPSLASAAEGAGGGGGSWLSLLLFTVNFTIFVTVVAYFAAPPVRGFFAGRAGAIRGDFARLESALQKAQDYQGRVAARMAQLEEELRRLGQDLEAETAFQVRKVRDDARVGAERLRRDTEMTIAARAREARGRVRKKLAAATAGPARELISRSFGPADQQRLVEAFMDRLRGEAQR